MSEQENKDHVRQVYQEVLSEGRVELIDERTVPDVVLHDPNRGDINGRDALKRYVERLRSGFPDLQITIEDIVAEGDKVAARWAATATHQGEFNGIPPTGRRAKASGMTFFRFAETGESAEEWVIGDNLGLLQQLGVLPELAPAGHA